MNVCRLKKKKLTKGTRSFRSGTKAQEKANTRILNTEIKSIARTLDANDPGDVLALLDKSTIQLDENGNYQGVEEAVNALKESKPWMFKKVVGADQPVARIQEQIRERMKFLL